MAKKTAAKNAAEERTPEPQTDQPEAATEAGQESPDAAAEEDPQDATGDGTPGPDSQDGAEAPPDAGSAEADGKEPSGAGAAAPTVQVAPLEPPPEPTPPAPKDPDTPGATVPPSLAASASRTEGDEFFDAETGECPDPDKLFRRVYEHGSIMRAQVRLMVRSTTPGLREPSVRLVMAKGTSMGATQAERIKAAVRRQAAAQK